MRALPGSGWRFSPGLVPFAEFGIDRRIPGAVAGARRSDRASTGLTGRVGTLFETDAAAQRARHSLGYQHRRYVDPTRRAIGGLIADVGLTWLPGRFTTITLRARQQPSTRPRWPAPARPGRCVSISALHMNCVAAWFCVANSVTASRATVGPGRPSAASPAESVSTIASTRHAAAALDYRWDSLRSTRPDAGYDASSYLLGLRLDY